MDVIATRNRHRRTYLNLYNSWRVTAKLSECLSVGIPPSESVHALLSQDIICRSFCKACQTCHASLIQSLYSKQLAALSPTSGFKISHPLHAPGGIRYLAQVSPSATTVGPSAAPNLASASMVLASGTWDRPWSVSANTVKASDTAFVTCHHTIPIAAIAVAIYYMMVPVVAVVREVSVSTVILPISATTILVSAPSVSTVLLSVNAVLLSVHTVLATVTSVDGALVSDTTVWASVISFTAVPLSANTLLPSGEAVHVLVRLHTTRPHTLTAMLITQSHKQIDHPRAEN